MANCNNLTIVVPFWNGYSTIGDLVTSLPPGIPVIIVDDLSDKYLRRGDVPERDGLRIIHPKRKGYFSGAVNAGVAACETDVLVLNQDVRFTSGAWLPKLEALRDTYALVGDGVMQHPAWPKGYVQGTFMYMRRDALDQVGGFDVEEYPLWGSTSEWQLRACRAGFKAQPSLQWRQHYVHKGRHDDSGQVRHGRRAKFGESIMEALKREPRKARQFIRTPPAISVVMPCYNYGRYLSDAIGSLLGGETCLGVLEPQTFQSFEVIIVDDASTDDSWDAAQDLADPWKAIHAIRLPQNRGTPGAINAGISRARGEYIHILSADDMRADWGLEALYRGCRTNPHSVAYGHVRVFKHGKVGRTLKLAEYDFDRLLRKNMMPAGIMYPKEAWREVGGYPAEMVYGREDWAFNIALGAIGWCGEHIGLSGNLYRREKQNRSLRTGNQHKGERGEGFRWGATFKKQLRSLYPDLYQGVRPVGCCNDRPDRKIPAGGARTPAQKVPDSEDGMVLLKYVGGNAGKLAWFVDGTRYYAGGKKTIISVAAAHAQPLLDIRLKRRKQFVRHRAPVAKKPQPVVPVEQAAIANPKDPDDLTVIMGVGSKTAEKLLAAGYASYLEVARSDPETLAKHVGINIHIAARATKGAADLI